MGQLIIIVAMFALLWVLLIRPQRKRQMEQRELHASIEVGDEILTAGGLYGHVRELGDEDDLILEIAPGTNVRIARRAVAGVIEIDEEDEIEDVAQEADEPEARPELEPESTSTDARPS